MKYTNLLGRLDVEPQGVGVHAHNQSVIVGVVVHESSQSLKSPSVRVRHPLERVYRPLSLFFFGLGDQTVLKRQSRGRLSVADVRELLV